jgi:hypothetical protein
MIELGLLILMVGVGILIYYFFQVRQIQTPKLQEDIYDFKVSKIFEKMFSQPSIWLGYQDFDPADSTDKIYLKILK